MKKKTKYVLSGGSIGIVLNEYTPPLKKGLWFRIAYVNKKTLETDCPDPRCKGNGGCVVCGRNVPAEECQILDDYTIGVFRKEGMIK